MSQRVLVVDDSATIRKVVSGILTRAGYTTETASDGQVALETLAKADGKFDIVLLDFVMPKMNGFQFCRAVRARREWDKLPVLLMSAKTDRIREQFVHQTGATDAITKPFEPQALVAAIEGALRRAEAGWAQAQPALVLDEADVPPMSSRGSFAREESAMRARASVEFAAKLANFIAPPLSKLPQGSIGDEAKIMQALASQLSSDALFDFGSALRHADMGERKILLAGMLGTIPIGAVLQLLQMEAQTGVLRIWNASSDIVIIMRGGLVDLVQSTGTGTEFRLGRFFLEDGVISETELEEMIAKSGARATGRSQKLLGESLVEAGRITNEQLKEALTRQSSELIYELLRWEAGRFEFSQQTPPEVALQAKLGMPVASVVMEGFRRVDEWRMMEARLGSFDAVLLPDPITIESVGKDKLARHERAIIDACDGARTVREVIAVSHLSSFDACRVLYQLIEARLVRRRAA